MLTSLSIRNVVLIEALDLDFHAGLTALTGETGAGKSIILDALGMATGARSDKALVRAGSENAMCVASFEVSPTHDIWPILAEFGISADPAEDILLRRTIRADGRSKAYINDQPASVKLLSAAGRTLLEVHGQHDGRGLMDASQHIIMLDKYGDYKGDIDACAASFERFKLAGKRLEELREASQRAADDRDFYEHSIAELDRLDPKEGEEEDLAARRRFLQSAESVVTELDAAQQALGEGGAFEARLATALRGLERVQSKLGLQQGKAGQSEVGQNGGEQNAGVQNTGVQNTGPQNTETQSAAYNSLIKAIGAMERAIIETEEARASIEDCARLFDADPSALNMAEERLFSLRAAARKYNTAITQLPAIRVKFAQHLFDIDNSEEALAKAEAEFSKAQTAYDKAAARLTKSRKAAAKTLDMAVMAELPALRMEKARFETHISAGKDSAAGCDAVQFTVSTNPGTPIGPLDKIASGGEMSRFALAIKVALAGDNEMSLIFDEVDQGVGGAVADAVGKRLSKLAKAAQVLVVTHSPQVAASANEQFLIRKSAIGDKTITQVTPLQAYAREEEIARMLSGEIITEEARAAARQLMGLT